MNTELTELYFSPNIIWVIEIRTIGWEGCVARLEGKNFRRKAVRGVDVYTELSVDLKGRGPE